MVELNVEYGEEKVFPSIFVKGNSPGLLRTNWLTRIYLDWKHIAEVTTVQATHLNYVWHVRVI